MALKHINCWVLLYTYDWNNMFYTFQSEAECWSQLVMIVDEHWSEAFDGMGIDRPVDDRERVLVYFDDNSKERFDIGRTY